MDPLRSLPSMQRAFEGVLMPRPLPTIDRAGRPQKDPSRLMSGIVGIVWVSEHVPNTLVPSEYWALDADDAGEQIAVISCPCGHSPTIPLLEAPIKCECERYFAFTGPDVWSYGRESYDATVVPA